MKKNMNHEKKKNFFFFDESLKNKDINK